MMGCFITQCEDDGSFSATQCHGSTGLCHCVNENGETTLQGTVRGEALECGPTLTACQTKQQQERADCGGMMGCYITQCNDDGSFSVKQCHEGLCHCVNEEGEKMAWGTAARGEELDCESVSTESKTPCQSLKEKEMAECGGRMGCFVTQCEDDGSFSATQCHGSTGLCHCVNELGETTLQATTRGEELDCTQPLGGAKPVGDNDKPAGPEDEEPMSAGGFTMPLYSLCAMLLAAVLA
jgi:hypothetical protein